MKFCIKYGWIFLVLLIAFSGFFRPPNEYTIRLAPTGVNVLFQALAASNGIPGEQRVELMRIIQEQIIQQDKDFAHFDSLRNSIRKDSTKKK